MSGLRFGIFGTLLLSSIDFFVKSSILVEKIIPTEFLFYFFIKILIQPRQIKKNFLYLKFFSLFLENLYMFEASNPLLQNKKA